MVNFSWGAFIRILPGLIKVVSQAYLDWRANKQTPKKVSAPLSNEQLSAALKAFQAKIPPILTYLDANPGVETAIDDLAEFFEAQGLVDVGVIEAGVQSADPALRELEKLIPDALFFLGGAFQAAPIGLPGGFGGSRGQIR